MNSAEKLLDRFLDFVCRLKNSKVSVGSIVVVVVGDDDDDGAAAAAVKGGYNAKQVVVGGIAREKDLLQV
jgi:hypothetical protein